MGRGLWKHSDPAAMPDRPTISAREVIFRPTAPAATRTIPFLLRSLPPLLWVVLYLLFCLPLLWDNWQKLASGTVPPWRWATALLFPLMLFGLLCILQMAGGRRDAITLRPDGLHLGRRGALKSFWTPVSCVVEPVRGAEGVYRLVVRASTPLSHLMGKTVSVYSGLTDDLEQARRFVEAFEERYEKS